MKFSKNIVTYIRCPSCLGQNLLTSEKEVTCPDCMTKFPYWGEMLWLFHNPEESRRDWQNRFNFFAQSMERDVFFLKEELKNPQLKPLTEKRLKRLIQAKVEHTREVLKILEPLEIKEQGKFEHSVALQVKFPQSQALMSYYDNVLRDWSYGDVENEACLDLIMKVLESDRELGHTVVLGAGACRLPYDIYRNTKCHFMALIDINPYLFLVAKRAISGKNLTLYEFPIAPVNLEAEAVKLKCTAPIPLKEGLEFVLTDAMNPSFKDASFDTVFTPWIIDIVHQDIRDQFRRFNRILKKGGRWINFGSLAFFHQKASLCYSFEETLEIVEESGFKIEKVFHEDLPYLHSPYSSQKRIEKILCFAARKVREIQEPEVFRYLPSWLLNHTEVIPNLADFAQQCAVHKTLAKVFEKIDGTQSLEKIAEKMAPELNLPVENVEVMLNGLLTKFFEDRLKGRQF